jgi:hypothetical protein
MTPTDTAAGNGKVEVRSGRSGSFKEAADGDFVRGPFEAALVMHKDGYVPLSKHLPNMESGAGELYKELEVSKHYEQEVSAGAGELVQPGVAQLASQCQQHKRQLEPVFNARCEWELDPRKVLVGRRLAVGGFAEVFLGKYEVSLPGV